MSETSTRTFESEVLIPAVQTFLTGIILGTGAALLAWLAGSEKYLEWGIAVWAATMIISWLMLLGRSWRLIERVLGVDLNNDGIIGEPELEPPLPKVRVIVDQIDGHAGEFIDLTLEPERLVGVSRSLMEGSTFSHSSLAGPGRPLTRAEYEQLRDEFLRRGLIRWYDDRAHNQGLRLTAKGQALTRHFAQMAPPLPDVHVQKKRK